MPTIASDRIQIYKYHIAHAFLWKALSTNDDQTNIRYVESYSSFRSDNSYIIDKQFVQFENNFKIQFEKLTSCYEGIDLTFAKQKLGESLSLILELFPDALSMELTHEKSIFYTIKKNDYTFFLQHFIEVDGENEEDEAMITVFKGKDKLPSFAGKLNDAIVEVTSYIFLPANTTKIESLEHEFSL